ncbi:lipopolysaccharide biosynthesis protein [Parasphingorhabdus sp.]|uniref:lipopolysaccharide biosynthesis protein n=1 Tax=Parasphingorhabdus sp. TaxID=2709688 RepID=UPI003298D110
MTGSEGLRSRLMRGAMWLGGARVATNILGFVSTLVLARLLVPADFGLVALATTLLGVLTAMTAISLSDALVQHEQPEKEHFDTSFTLNLARGVLVGAFFAAISVPTAAFFEDARLIELMLVLSLTAVLTGLENPKCALFMRDLIFWQQSVMLVSQKAVALVVSLTIAFLYQSYWALIIGVVLGQAVSVLLSYALLPYRPRFTLSKTRDLFSFSIWLTFCNFITTLNWNFDNLLVGKVLGKTSLGYYSMGNHLAVMPTREVTSPIIGTLFPAFSNLKQAPERLRAAYQRAQSIVTAIALPAGVGMALVADPFVRLAMGEKWLPAVIVIQCLASIFAIQTLASLAHPLAMALGNTKLLFTRDLIAFAYRVPLLVVGLYLGGLEGIVYMRVFTGRISIYFNASIVSRLIEINYWEQLKPNLRTFAGIISMTMAVYAIGVLLPEAVDNIGLAINLAALIGGGAVVHIIVVGFAWNFMGRPVGIEDEALALVQNLLRRTRARFMGPA